MNDVQTVDTPEEFSNLMPIAEAIAQAQEQLQAADQEGAAAATTQPPNDRPLPFEPPEFDMEAALVEIANKSRLVAALEADWEGCKEETSQAKKRLERAERELRDFIAEIDDKRRAQERLLTQPYLAPVDDAPKPRGCAYERSTGRPCPVCRVKAGEAAPAVEDVETHARAEAEECGELLQLVNVHIGADVIATWSREEREAVEAYAGAIKAELDGQADAVIPERPAVLGTQHVALEAADGEQRCKVCAAVIAKPEGDDDVLWSYDLGALVGVDCAGDPTTGAIVSQRPCETCGTGTVTTWRTPNPLEDRWACSACASEGSVSWAADSERAIEAGLVPEPARTLPRRNAKKKAAQ